MNRRSFFSALALAPVIAVAQKSETPKEFDRRVCEAWYRSRDNTSESDVQRLADSHYPR